MNVTVPLLVATVVALAYALFVLVVAVRERRDRGGGGGWIRLPGIGTFLLVLPMTLLFEKLGHRFDFRRDLDVGVAVAGTSLLVGAVVFALAALVCAWCAP